MCVTARGLQGARRTGEAGSPGHVQVEVLGGVNEHVQVPVWLRKEQKTPHSSFICAHTTQGCCYYLPPNPPKDSAHCRLQQISAANGS